MAWTLRYTPPNTNPYWVEHTYAENVEVVNGIAVVQTIAAKDFLLKLGFEIAPKEELDEKAVTA